MLCDHCIVCAVETEASLLSKLIKLNQNPHFWTHSLADFFVLQ